MEPSHSSRSASSEASEASAFEPDADPPQNGQPAEPRQEATDRPWLHAFLFVLTLASTVYAGGQWVNRVLFYEAQGETVSLLFTTVPMGWLVDGLRYAIPLLGFLTVHEFGHYFAARYHRVNTSLPYYIPFFPQINLIGTFGAVISIREAIPSKRKLFDIGAAGPLAGFVVAMGALLYGFATLPPPEYLLDLTGHEALKEHIRQYGTFPATPPEPASGALVIVVGQTPLFWLLSQFFANVPPMYEIYHYPVLFAGWLGLFFTALNLLPVGQLDGGHILYALLGPTWHRRLAQAFVLLLLVLGGMGFVKEAQTVVEGGGLLWRGGAWLLLAAIFYGYLTRIFRTSYPARFLALAGLMAGVGTTALIGSSLLQYGYSGWLIWTLLIVFLVRVEHPPVMRSEELTPTRRVLGYVAMAIFLLCFSIQPLSVL